MPTFPYVLGSDGAGTVVTVGEGDSRFKPGDRAYAFGLMLAEVDNSYYLGINLSVGFALPGGR